MLLSLWIGSILFPPYTKCHFLQIKPILLIIKIITGSLCCHFIHPACSQCDTFLLLLSTSVSAALSKPPWPCPRLLVFTFACHDSPDFYCTVWQPWKESDSFGAESLDLPCCVTVCKAPEKPHTVRPSKIQGRNGNGQTCMHKNLFNGQCG